MVGIFVAVTDRNWHDFLSAMQPDEVNFWAPSGRTTSVHCGQANCSCSNCMRPDNYIVGGGVFSHASNLPLSLAWDAFGIKNGTPDLVEMRRRANG